MKTIGYLLVSLFLLCSCVQEQSKVVSLTSGLAQGVYADSIYSFKGIPYAKAARFMPPEQPDIWDTVRIFIHMERYVRRLPYHKETTSSPCVNTLLRERIA